MKPAPRTLQDLSPASLPVGRRTGFTVVEMLVVVFVVGVLTSIIVPAISGVRREALSVSCQANLRQLHAGIEAYRSSLKGLLPMCDFLPASTPDGPVGGLVEVLEKTIGRDCECWYCAADDDIDADVFVAFQGPGGTKKENSREEVPLQFEKSVRADVEDVTHQCVECRYQHGAENQPTDQLA